MSINPESATILGEQNNVGVRREVRARHLGKLAEGNKAFHSMDQYSYSSLILNYQQVPCTVGSMLRGICKQLAS